MFRSVPTRVALASLALASLAWQGCSSDGFVTGPAGDRSDFDATVRRTPISAENWTVVASQKIIPGQVMTLTGSRYTLEFPQGAVHNAMDITISERSHDFVDVKLDPDGTVFGEAVTLTIDYSGTANDPASPFFNTLPPRVGRFNPASRSWEWMAGTNDVTTKTYTVMLSGFSRYAMTDGMVTEDGPSTPGHTENMQ